MSSGGKKITKNIKEEFIGQGSFGCVIKPDPPCNKRIVSISNYKPKNSIAKIYTDIEAYDNDISIKKEIEFSKLISKFDKNQNYFVMPTKFCKNTKKQMNTHKAFKLCKISPLQKNFLFSVMENEEYDFIEYIIRYKKNNNKYFPKKAWIILLENLLNGLKLLIKHKCVHQDIKANNITYKNKLKFIDFGLFEHFKNVYTTQNNRLIIRAHYYPLEYILIDDYLHTQIYNNTNYQNASTHLLHEFYESIYDYGYIGTNNYYSFISKNELDNYSLEQINKYISDPKKYYENIQKYTDKIDLYALGTMCIYINHILSNDDLSEKELNNYNKFVKGLIEIDPAKRYNIQDALKHYYTILEE